MKKTLMIALAGMMLFAFTQCGSNDGGKVAKGSKEYQDNVELYNQIEKAIKNAKTCDELSDAILTTFLAGLTKDKTYTEEEKMTEEEAAELEKLGDNFKELFEKQAEKLGCEDDDFKLF